MFCQIPGRIAPTDGSSSDITLWAPTTASMLPGETSHLSPVSTKRPGSVHFVHYTFEQKKQNNRPIICHFPVDAPSALIRHSGARRRIKNKSWCEPVGSLIAITMFFIIHVVLMTTQSCSGGELCGAVRNTEVISECFSAIGCRSSGQRRELGSDFQQD